jgi:hypothetical protein
MVFITNCILIKTTMNSGFCWKNNLRKRINDTKIALNDRCNFLRVHSDDQHNQFIDQIFTGYNVLVQMTEVDRRGIGAILESLCIRGAHAKFLILSIAEDVLSIQNAIKRLYLLGSHVDLRPDELEYIQYLDPRQVERGSAPYALGCLCGECYNSDRRTIQASDVSATRFDRPIPQEETIDAMLEEFENQGQDVVHFGHLAEREALHGQEVAAAADDARAGREQIVLNSDGTLRVRAIVRDSNVENTPYLNSELIVDIPESVGNSSLINPLGGRLSFAFDLQRLYEMFRDIGRVQPDPEIELDIVEMDFVDVPVILNPCCYTQSVTIESVVHGSPACSICLGVINGGGAVSFDDLCVKVRCCGQVFHDSCLRHLLCNVGPPKCPLCRHDMRDVMCA